MVQMKQTTHLSATFIDTQVKTNEHTLEPQF